jgi:hypothetical protein
MNCKILLLALVAFSFLLAGCGGKKADESPSVTGVSAQTPEGTPPAEHAEAPDGDKEKLANLFDIEIDEPPGDFEYSKAPGEE